jgi:rubrerythrin
MVPFWPAWVTTAICTAFTWRLDTLARRRERLGRCPKCNYDRAGIAAGAVCPECGDIPKVV